MNIVADYAEQVSENFTEFLQVLQQDNRYDDLHSSITAYLTNSDMDAQAHSKIFHLMGIYARIKYGNEAIATLPQLVEIPTHIVDRQK